MCISHKCPVVLLLLLAHTLRTSDVVGEWLYQASDIKQDIGYIQRLNNI